MTLSQLPRFLSNDVTTDLIPFKDLYTEWNYSPDGVPYQVIGQLVTPPTVKRSPISYQIEMEEMELEGMLGQINALKKHYKHIPEAKADGLLGKTGYVYEDGDQLHIHAQGRSKKHFKGMKQSLGFLHLEEDEGDKGTFVWKPKDGETLTDRYSAAIRKAVGLGKKRDISDEKRATLKRQIETFNAARA